MTYNKLEPLGPAQRYLPHAIWISGFVLSALTGVIVRQSLAAQGIPVVSWGEGISLMIPFALWAEIPFGVLALIAVWLLRRRQCEDPASLPKWIYMIGGALAGLLAAQAQMLYGMMSYHGPGGFIEVVFLTIGLPFVTVPMMLGIGAIGVFVGAVVGFGIWIFRGRPVVCPRPTRRSPLPCKPASPKHAPSWSGCRLATHVA